MRYSIHHHETAGGFNESARSAHSNRWLPYHALSDREMTAAKVVRFDVQDAQVSRRPWIAESDPPLATIDSAPRRALRRVSLPTRIGRCCGSLVVSD
jgi:hypothetical protein